MAGAARGSSTAVYGPQQDRSRLHCPCISAPWAALGHPALGSSLPLGSGTALLSAPLGAPPAPGTAAVGRWLHSSQSSAKRQRPPSF